MGTYNTGTNSIRKDHRGPIKLIGALLLLTMVHVLKQVVSGFILITCTHVLLRELDLIKLEFLKHVLIQVSTSAAMSLALTRKHFLRLIFCAFLCCTHGTQFDWKTREFKNCKQDD